MGESWASNEGVARSMRSNRRSGTRPELGVRRALFALGLRYRVDFAPGRNKRRKADIVFTKSRIAVFIDGCFWHGCPLHATIPKANSRYWVPKLARNVERDRETNESLKDEGWVVLRYWEHESTARVIEDVRRHVRARPSEKVASSRASQLLSPPLA